MARNSSGGYRFRVSDAVEVPLRGTMLRLKRVEGQPSLGALEPGSTVRLQSPEGDTREVSVRGISVTGGRSTQANLDRYGQLDLIIAPEDAAAGGRPVTIGWFLIGG